MTTSNDKLYIYTHIIPTRYTQSSQKYASRRIEAVVGLLSLWSKWLTSDSGPSMHHNIPPPPPHTHTHTQMQILLLPLGGHTHLAKPGCLCTKQVSRASAEQTPGAGLGTRRRPDSSSQQMVWAPEVPHGP